jgi:hypothetical protein
VAGTNTVTIPAAAGTVMVSGNMPAFSAYANTNQSYSQSTHTKVTFGSELYDTNNNFANSTFTPTVAGYYQINTGISTNNTITRFLVEIYKNGSRLFVLSDASTSMNTIGGGALVYCNGTTDYIEIYVYTVGASTLYGVSDSTWVNGVLVRTA